MSFLPEVAKRLRKPLREGKGIKVFCIQEDVAVGTRVKLKSGRTGKVERKLTHFSDETPFYKVKVAGQKSPTLVKQHEFEIIKEGWGPEDILQDMMEDKSVRRLFKDIKKLLRGGTPLNDIAASIQHLEDAASTRLTAEERTVLLKHLEKKEHKWRGPKRGLEAYNKRMRKFQLPGEKPERQYTTKYKRPVKEDVSSIFNHQIRSLFNKFKNGKIHYSDAMRQVDELTKDRHDADKWRAALHSLRNVNEEEEWGVFATGGSIGSKNDKPYATYADKKKAQGHAKRLRKQLTPGERGYYKMGYSVRRITEGYVDTVRLTQLRNLVENINRALETAYTHSDANDANGYYAALNSADKHIQAYVRKYGGFKLNDK